MLPRTCFDCQCLDKDNPVAAAETLYDCNRNGGKASIAEHIAKTQAVCLEDTQPVTPHHKHLQDITPKE